MAHDSNEYTPLRDISTNTAVAELFPLISWTNWRDPLADS
jgi:hypothetical protein